MATKKKTRNAYGQGCTYRRGPGNFWIKYPPEMVRQGYKPHGGFATEELADKVRLAAVSKFTLGESGYKPDPKDVAELGPLVEAWLARRDATHRSNKQDRYRWARHLAPFFAHKRPAEVTHADIRAYIEAKLATGLNPNTVGHSIRGLSTIYTDLVERKLAPANVIRSLPLSTRRLYRPTYDPKSAPYLRSIEERDQVFRALASRDGRELDPIAVCFAIGSMAGLRTGEQLACSWDDSGNRIDLESNVIVVRCAVRSNRLNPTKNGKTREVPIAPGLRPILATFKLATGGKGLLFPPAKATGGNGRQSLYMKPHTLHTWLGRAIVALREAGASITVCDWYQATRHTFASVFVMAGGSLYKLCDYMGHSSIKVTERYAHLSPDKRDPGALACLGGSPMASAAPTAVRLASVPNQPPRATTEILSARAKGQSRSRSDGRFGSKAG